MVSIKEFKTFQFDNFYKYLNDIETQWFILDICKISYRTGDLKMILNSVSGTKSISVEWFLCFGNMQTDMYVT